MELTASEQHDCDTILHDSFPKEVEADLHRHQGPGVVSPKFKYWVITDRRTGKAMYGHC